MSEIFFGLYKGFSSTSMAIRMATRSDISHVSIFKPGLIKVCEAWPGGVRETEWAERHLPTTEILIYKIKCTAEQQRIFYEYAQHHVDNKTPYDYAGVFGFKFHYIKQNPDALFCSEYFLLCAFRAGLILLDCYPSEASPRDIKLIPSKELVEVRVVPGELPKPETLAEYKSRLQGE